MARFSIRDLRQNGVTETDLRDAFAMQEAQRRAGAPVQPVAVIVGVQEPRKGSPKPPVDLTAPALRRRGVYDQAAFLLDQRALGETPERAARARMASQIAKELSASQQLEFDFFKGGNVSIAFQYQDAVTERLYEAAPTTTKAKEAGFILWTICRNLEWQSYECTKIASDLCEITRTKPSHMSDALDLLEQVGAIRRVKRGRAKIITVTPEGAFRGDVNNHAQAVEKYRLEVIEGGKKDPSGA